MRFFNNTLRNRLIAAFFAVGLFSVTISTYIVVRVNTSKLARQIETAVIEASRKTVEVIEEFQENSGRISRLLLDNPAFRNSLQRWESPSVIQTGNPLVLWLPGGDEDLRPGKDIIKIEKPEVLISGVLEAVHDEEGKHIGNLLVGHELGKSFAQEMSLFTNVEISIFYRRNSGGAEDEKEKQMEKHFSLGEAYYDRGADFHGTRYEAYYHPLLTSRGEVAGIVFAGIPRSYGFSEIVGTWTFFPFLIALAALMAGGLGYTAAGFMSKPIMTFTKGVLDVARGNLDRKINIDSTEELSELSRAFNHMTEKLRELREIEKELRRKERLAALGELSAGVAHEIRNPLGIIKNSAQMLKKTGGGEGRTKELTGFIIEEVERLNRVITNFLDFARPRSVRKERISVETIMTKSIRLCEHRIAESGISVNTHFPENLPEIFADEELLKQAFLNIFMNAVDAMPGGGELGISARVRSEEAGKSRFVEVVVRDSGCGIPGEAVSRIFDPFYSTKEGGSGLGLSIVHKILESHGGDITVEDGGDTGAKFRIRLPLA